jgi:presenilin-like A22 family membrane protease
MNASKRNVDVFPILSMSGLFVVAYLIAFLVAGPFEAAGAVAFENPSDPLNIAYFFAILLIFTAVILVIIKLRKPNIIRAIFLGSITVLSVYVFYPILSLVIPSILITLGLSIGASVALLILLIKKPEWYIIDAIAMLTGVGAIAMIGISLNIWIVIVLLIAMAVYDAFSVYKTKHMIDLADSIMDQKLPVMFVIPKKKGYSFLKKTKGLKEKLQEGEPREAYFLGLGDVVFPGILAVAAFHNLASNGLLVALCVLVGTLIGFMALMVLVSKGKPQAGLPFLCSGAILGYIISNLAVFGLLHL